LYYNISNEGVETRQGSVAGRRYTLIRSPRRGRPSIATGGSPWAGCPSETERSEGAAEQDDLRPSSFSFSSSAVSATRTNEDERDFAARNLGRNSLIGKYITPKCTRVHFSVSIPPRSLKRPTFQGAGRACESLLQQASRSLLATRFSGWREADIGFRLADFSRLPADVFGLSAQEGQAEAMEKSG
jgi:hypothetical protein